MRKPRSGSRQLALNTSAVACRDRNEAGFSPPSLLAIYQSSLQPVSFGRRVFIQAVNNDRGIIAAFLAFP